MGRRLTPDRCPFPLLPSSGVFSVVLELTAATALAALVRRGIEWLLPTELEQWLTIPDADGVGLDLAASQKSERTHP